MRRTIRLEDMRFHAFHGVMAEENVVGGEYLVSVSFDYDFSVADETDNLSGTIDYSLVHSLVSREMNSPSKLIEHVAGRIFRTIKSEFDGVEALSVSVSKLNPPITGEVRCATVSIAE